MRAATNAIISKTIKYNFRIIVVHLYTYLAIASTRNQDKNKNRITLDPDLQWVYVKGTIYLDSWVINTTRPRDRDIWLIFGVYKT